jgi:MFS transporter, DHA2 family, multidrug resistance protein
MTDEYLPRLPRWAGFVALCIGMFMAILDIQVVVTSLNEIQDALEIGADQMSWIQTAYIIAEVIAIPTTGLLMRVFSMRWLFVGALTMFTLASIGCAGSTGIASLLVFRVLQGFAGGVLIPLVFSAIFLLFPNGFERTLATTVGGLLAVLAPALGPLVGGWITETFSWHWLFLINVFPGVIAIAMGAASLTKTSLALHLLRTLDWLSLALFGLGLAAFVIGMKEAPGSGWLSAVVLSCLAASAALITLSMRRRTPAIPFHLLKDRGLAYGCAISFILGIGLFSCVYIMPVFLSIVRGHGPYAIGVITLVMGLTQIISAPVSVQIDRFFDARWLAALGFGGFAIGLAVNANLTPLSDYDHVFWPQVLRGAFIALCILPPIRLAIGMIPKPDIGDASGLFNLARNIGGVFGIALSDTIMFGRTPDHAERIQDEIRSAPETAAAELGVSVDELPAIDDPSEMMGMMDVVQSAALTSAINECWWVLGAITALTLPLLLLAGPLPSAKPTGELGGLKG